MVYTITKDNIDDLKNNGLKADAKRYIEQYENFLEYIKERKSSPNKGKQMGDRQQCHQ